MSDEESSFNDPVLEGEYKVRYSNKDIIRALLEITSVRDCEQQRRKPACTYSPSNQHGFCNESFRPGLFRADFRVGRFSLIYPPHILQYK